MFRPGIPVTAATQKPSVMSGMAPAGAGVSGSGAGGRRCAGRFGSGRKGAKMSKQKRLIDANELKDVLITTLEKIKSKPKMDGQEMHIIAACHVLGQYEDTGLELEAAP